MINYYKNNDNIDYNNHNPDNNNLIMIIDNKITKIMLYFNLICNRWFLFLLFSKLC